MVLAVDLSSLQAKVGFRDRDVFSGGGGQRASELLLGIILGVSRFEGANRTWW